MKIVNKKYNILNKLNKKIVLISDIHYYSKKDLKRINLVLDNIKKIKPDYICIPGDITDKSIIRDEELFINWLKKLSRISKVIISLGNHEFYVTKNILKLNSSFLSEVSKIKNLYLLDNENIVIDNINFMGITMPIECYENNNLEEFYKILSSLKTYKKYYNVLLCHSPINIIKKSVLKNRNIDLILCGHMHGGVVLNFMRKIFKNNGLISPNRKLFPKQVYGHLKIEKTNIIITSGIKVLPVRFMNNIFKPEIVQIYM